MSGVQSVHPTVAQILDEPLEAGRQAARNHAWRDAYDLLHAADGDGLLDPADLEYLGEAAWWTGRLEEAMDFRERAYAAFTGAGEPRSAALVALKLSLDNAAKGDYAVAGGWLSRAETLLAEEPEGFEHGHLELARGATALEMGQLEAALAHLARAGELGAQFGDRSLEALAKVFKGTVLVISGQVTEGLALLDEATASAVRGELEPLATGMVYCVTIHSCQELGGWGRGSEWTRTPERRCQ